MKTLDYTAVGLYMTIMVVVGLSLGRQVRNISDYFKGANAVSWVANGISNFMTMFSAFVFVAYAGIAYKDGFVALTVLWCSVPATIFAALVLAKRWRRAEILTPVEFLEVRFNASVRQLLSWGGVLFKILDETIKLYAIGLFVSSATQISLETAIISCGIVVALYTVAGGLLAVVVTDVVQFIILVLATLILVPLSLSAAGGFSEMQTQIPENLSLFKGEKGNFMYLLVYYIMIIIKYNGNWAFIQRFYSAKNEQDSIKTAWLTAILFLVFPVIFLLPSVAAPLIIPNLDNPEMAYVSICLKLLPEGILGLMIAAMFAATMSTLSAEYNVTASVMTKDIYQRLFRPHASPQELLWAGRMMTVTIGVLVTIGALFVGGFGGAFEANKLFTGLFAIPMAIPLVLGILFYRPNATGVWAMVAGGVAIGLWLNASQNVSWEIATLIEIVVCILIFILSSLLKNSASYLQRVQTFFQKLNTPIERQVSEAIEESTAENNAIKSSLSKLYAFSLGCTGVMFVLLSFPSIEQLSGQMSFFAGFVCLIVALSILWKLKKTINN